MGRGRFYTEVELCRAMELKASGLTWPVVAERLGRGSRAIMEAVAHHKRNIRVSERIRLSRERTARMIAAAEAGERISVIAKREGVTIAYACTMLRSYGLDSEVRAEIRAALQMRRAA